MPLYICVAFAKNTVLTVADFEGDTLSAAIVQAELLCLLWPQCTRYELWSNGVKVHSGLPGETA